MAARAERLQHQPRRHDLFGQRARRRACADVARRSGRSTGSASRCPNLRALRAGAGLYSHWDDHEFVNDFTRTEHGGPALRNRCEGIHGLRARRATPARTGSTARSAGASTSSSSSSTSARSAAERSTRPAAAISLRPRRSRCGTRSPRSFLPSRARWHSVPRRDRRPRRARCSARASSTPSAARSTPPPRRSRSSSTRCRCSSSTRCRTTAGRGTPPTGARLLAAIAGVRNVVVLTTDAHANLIGEIRRQTLEGPPLGTGDLGGRHRPGCDATRTRRRSTESLELHRARATSSRRSSSSRPAARDRHGLCGDRRLQLRAGDGDADAPDGPPEDGRRGAGAREDRRPAARRSS